MNKQLFTGITAFIAMLATFPLQALILTNGGSDWAGIILFCTFATITTRAFYQWDQNKKLDQYDFDQAFERIVTNEDLRQISYYSTAQWLAPLGDPFELNYRKNHPSNKAWKPKKTDTSYPTQRAA